MLGIDEFQREVFAEPRPFVMHGGTRNRELARKFRLNDLGYRGPLPAATKPHDEFRIFIVGGSTVLVGEPSVPELLESAFHQAGNTNVKVFNFGVMAANTRMDLTRVLYELLELKADLVIGWGPPNGASTWQSSFFPILP